MSAALSRRMFVQRLAGLGALTMLAACGGPVATPSATQRKYRIGYLAPRVPECEDASAWQVSDGVALKIGESLPSTSGCQAATLVGALAQLGYRQGENFEFVVAGPPTFGAAQIAGFVRPAEELVARHVDIIVTVGEQAPKAAMQATTTIPIVAYNTGEFVENGIVPNLTRPGGNVTGVSLSSAVGKRLELLKEAFPWVKQPILVHGPFNLPLLAQEREVARQMGLVAVPVLWTSEGSDFIVHAKEAIAAGADSMLVMLGTARPPGLPAFIKAHRLATVGNGLGFADTGYVLALGTGGQANPLTAEYIDRILNGANPGDLPVISTTTFVTYVNLKLAAEFGLTIPQSVIARANTVIE